MLAKRTSKNQVTLPKAIADVFPEIKYFDVSMKGDKILLVPVKIVPFGTSFTGAKAKRKRTGKTRSRRR